MFGDADRTPPPPMAVPFAIFMWQSHEWCAKAPLTIIVNVYQNGIPKNCSSVGMLMIQAAGIKSTHKHTLRDRKGVRLEQTAEIVVQRT